MILIIMITAVLFCIVLAAALVLLLAIKCNHARIVPILFILWAALSWVLIYGYKEWVHPYFIGSRITQKQICEDVRQVELYWK